ncbi:hypothetical protein HK098_000149 [Nowakowskiella sp. JEL0407]|nr:hypothetical protein HK098_000149 [Nowakowskiella sp. JEL0407]
MQFYAYILSALVAISLLFLFIRCVHPSTSNKSADQPTQSKESSGIYAASGVDSDAIIEEKSPTEPIEDCCSPVLTDYQEEIILSDLTIDCHPIFLDYKEEICFKGSKQRFFKTLHWAEDLEGIKEFDKDEVPLSVSRSACDDASYEDGAITEQDVLHEDDDFLAALSVMTKVMLFEQKILEANRPWSCR